MKNNLVHLQQFVVESLHPETLARQQFSSSEFKKWKNFVDKEIEKIYPDTFKSLIWSHNRRDEYIYGIITQITELSNIINDYIFKYSRVWHKHAAAKEIRQGYVSSCLAFENVIGDLTRRFPAIAERTRFTDYVLNAVKIELKKQLVSVKAHLQNQSLDFELSSVINDGLTHLVNQRPLLRAHDAYLRKLMADIQNTQFNDSGNLTDYMIVNDFNLPEFFLFCVDAWSDQLTALDGLSEQKEMLLDTKSHLFDLTLTRGLKFPLTKQRLYNELNKFLSEKYSLVKERLKISHQFATNEGLRPRAKRVLINLSVAQLGLFIRLQVEKGILAKDHIGELFTFFAKNFYTPNTDFISADSLQKKSSDVEHATAVKLKAHLIAMLNWLNSHYNLSNYN